MATRASIVADLNRARKQADDLDRAAEKLNNASGDNGLAGALNIVGNNWTGVNARSYMSKGGILQNRMNKTVSDLRNAASTIRSVAQNIYNVELANIERAEAEERARREAEAAAWVSGNR